MLRFINYFTVIQLLFGINIIKADTISEYLNEVTLDLNSKYRLPKNVIPHEYVLEFDPDFLNEYFTFSGRGEFHIEVLRSTSSIVMHKSSTLDIISDTVILYNNQGKAIKPSTFYWISNNEFYQIIFDIKLDPGHYKLFVEWKGRDAVNDWYLPRIGFFRAENTDESSEKTYLITTHFEAEGARSAFPCWDEPVFKAQFKISIKHLSNYTALSNMPVKNKKNLHDGRILTQFNKTPNISTYLLCMLVANYSSIQNSQGNVSFYGVPNRTKFLRYALNASEAVVSVMEKYTGIPYVLPKLDQITVPQYISYGMEHWGIASYLTNIIEEKKTSLIPNFPRDELITYVITHETIHQWFGNLVSINWWGETWLAEGITVYFEYKIMDMIHPEWKMMEMVAVKQLNEDAFEADTTAKHPVRWNPNTKMEIVEIFSGVTYSKAAGLVQMIDFIMTHDVFQKGLQLYLNEHKFGTATTDDLWMSFQQVYDQSFPSKPLDIKKIMDPWLDQVGHPILSVERNYSSRTIRICQNNFRADFNDSQWTIPITYSFKSKCNFRKTTPMYWLAEKCMSISGVETNDWIILNNQQRGFYRVNYDKRNWQMLTDYLNSNEFKKIHPINRAQLVYDIYRLYKDDKDFLEILINLIRYLHQEVNDLPWIPAKTVIKDFKKVLDNTCAEKIFSRFVLHLLENVIGKIGFEYRKNESYRDTRLRYSLTGLACDFHHPGCQAHANNLFNSFLKNPSENSFPDDDWSWVLCSGLREANESVLDRFMTGDLINIPSTVHSQRFNYIKCINDVHIRRKYLMRFIRRNSDLNAKNIYDMFQSFLDGDNENVNFVIDFVIEKFNKIETFFNDKQEDINMLALISRISLSTKCLNQYQKWKSFLHSKMENLKQKYDNILLEKMFGEMETVMNNSMEFTNEFIDVLKKINHHDTAGDCTCN